ncbi:hypothetical protein [Brunnivagina elsteri]|uniref:DUF2505 domain-containing protein n=1 Tax=Brunnivagina elsteri CCALA 953 TaxID=987040 RepID=A0A2A2TNJ9_9CYAN|nr:hypothetical protein [Calothrix elsteri]PAX60116.1 hypothetical protein CK510_03570 [Calothrix elsteri CCALA 953]
MKISTDTRIPFPRQIVYATYRDKLTELVRYIPDIRDIKVKSRKEANNMIYTVNEWHGGGDIPMAARALLSEDMLSWLEYNTWNEQEFLLEWTLETRAFTEAVYCAGKNSFIEDGNNTIIQSRGELKIDPNKIHGAPSFLTGQIARVVEDFLASKITPSLLQMSEGVKKYLEKN